MPEGTPLLDVVVLHEAIPRVKMYNGGRRFFGAHAVQVIRQTIKKLLGK